MTKHSAKEIVKQVRGRYNPISDSYVIFIGNISGAFEEAGKTLTKENIELVLNGFAISMILSYVCDLDLEAETDTLLTDGLVMDVSNIMWDDWLKENIEKHRGDNVVPIRAVN